MNQSSNKCHGCLDGILRLFREELGEWWHFPDNLGAYRCQVSLQENQTLHDNPSDVSEQNE